MARMCHVFILTKIHYIIWQFMYETVFAFACLRAQARYTQQPIVTGSGFLVLAFLSKIFNCSPSFCVACFLCTALCLGFIKILSHDSDGR